MEFTDIVLKSSLPIDQYLVENSRLSLRLIVNGIPYSETPIVDGNHETGRWVINARLQIPQESHSFKLAAIVNVGGLKVQLLSIEHLVSNVMMRLKERPDKRYKIIICEPRCPIQLYVICKTGLLSSPTGPPFISIRRVNDASGERKSYTGSNTEGKNSEIPSREDLRSFYQKAASLPACDTKVTVLSQLGCFYHALYEETKQKADLERAVSIHEEATRSASIYYPNLPGLFKRTGDALKTQFNQNGDPAIIEKAILYYEHALTVTKDGNPNKSSRLCDLGTGLYLRFQHLGHLGDLDRLISIYQKVIDTTPNDHPDKPNHLNNFGIALQRRFERLGNFIDMDNAISVHQEALKITPDNHLDKPSLLSNLGSSLKRRFNRLGTLADIDSAISVYQEAVEMIPDGHPDKPSLLDDFGNSILCRFEHLGSLTDIDSAIAVYQEAMEITPGDHPEKALRLRKLGNSLRLRFERFGSPTDIDRAISVLQEAVKITPDDHTDKPGCLINLGSSLLRRFERLGTLADVDSAILLQQEAVKMTPEDHIDKPLVLRTFGNTLSCRFKRLGILTDVDNAISMLQQAATITPNDHPGRPGLLDDLGNSLLHRFKRLENTVDIDRAISVQQEAVRMTPNGHPDKLPRLSDLGNSLLYRFERLESLIDLDSAISVHQEALKMTPDSHPEKPSRLGNLGNSLSRRFERLGNLVDVDSAISALQEALKMTLDVRPGDSLLNSLGCALMRRFRRLGSITDIDNAISIYQEALKMTPDSHPRKASQLSNFGNSLLNRFERLGNITDIDRAISVQKEAVKMTPDSHPGKPSLLNNLGTSLIRRFDYLEVLADLDSAISIQQEAVKMTPSDHPGKRGLLNNLGGSLASRFKRLGSLIDIDNAISMQREAVKITPDDHFGKSGLLSNLGISLLSRFARLRDYSDLENALQSYSLSALSLVGPPMVRFEAACSWARTAHMDSRSPLPAFRCAINLLPRIAWLGLKETDQHALLAQIGGIVREAVAVAIEHEEYETAVEWAEQGRSIVWQNILNLRSPIDDLAVVNLTLANRLKDVGRQLESVISQDTESGKMPAVPVEDVAQRYSRLGTEWDTIVEEIRRIPNFEDFLAAKSFAKLASAGFEGPVVILNAYQYRCDAMVLIQDESSDSKVSVVNIPLESGVYEMSEDLLASMTGLLSSAGARSRSVHKHALIQRHTPRNCLLYEPPEQPFEDLMGRLSLPKLCTPNRKSEKYRSFTANEFNFSEILGFLWVAVVKPVLDGLAISDESDHPLRIWWCVTGALSFLPIHAAGIYGTGREGNIISDYVVSSYTPTLTAILDQSQLIVQENFQMLTVAVAQSSIPNSPPIYGTENEVKLVQSLAKANGIQCVNLTKDNATVKRVIQGMIESHWIHLACHGQQNVKNSMESGFLFHDGVLKLSQIVRLSLPKADFAFLSACQTATGDEKIAEESVHLAAGMLLSGCRGLIATMWSISDNDAPKVAEDVYCEMLKDGIPNRKGAAYALHEAVKKLRESGADFLSWVPFIHIGR